MTAMLIFRKVGMCQPDFSQFSFDQVKAPEKRERGAAVKGEGRVSVKLPGPYIPRKLTMEPKTWRFGRLGGGFKYLLILPLLGEDSHFD